MKGSFGKTSFGGVIMHGMNNFGLLTRMLTDWAYPAGGIQRRLETRWLKPVRPGDTIQPFGTIKAKQTTQKSRWVLIDVLVQNQAGGLIASRRGDDGVPARLARNLTPPRSISGHLSGQTARN